MKIIAVDDERTLLDYFARLSRGIGDLEISGLFEDAQEALDFARVNTVDAAFLDIEMPGMNGIALAQELRALYPEIVIVFISAYDTYVRDFNAIGGDYYMLKPYEKEQLEQVFRRVQAIAASRNRKVHIQMFGSFNVYKGNEPVIFSGKPREILAYMLLYCGRQANHQQIYMTVWDSKTCTPEEMVSYFHAVRKLKEVLQENEIEDVLISNRMGHRINTGLVSCDLYSWLEENPGKKERTRMEILTEFSWAKSAFSQLMLLWE